MSIGRDLRFGRPYALWGKLTDLIKQQVSGGLVHHDSSFPIVGRNIFQRQYGSAPVSNQGQAQGQLGSFPLPLGQGQTQWQNGPFPPPLGGQGRILGHRSFPPPTDQGQPQGQRTSFTHVSAQGQVGFLPQPPTEYDQIDPQQNLWTPPMTPTYPLTLEQYHVPRYPIDPALGFASNGQDGQNLLPAEAGFTDGQAYPESESVFGMGLRLEDSGPEDFATLRGTAPGNPIEQPIPSGERPVLPPADQQTYGDYEDLLFTLDTSAQTPRSEWVEIDAQAGENTGLVGEDLDDGRLEEFMNRWAWNVADRQQPEGGAQGGEVEEMEVEFENEFEREMNQLVYGLETPRSMDTDPQSETNTQPAETGVQSPEPYAQLEQDIEPTESKCGGE